MDGGCGAWVDDGHVSYEMDDAVVHVLAHVIHVVVHVVAHVVRVVVHVVVHVVAHVVVHVVAHVVVHAIAHVVDGGGYHEGDVVVGDGGLKDDAGGLHVVGGDDEFEHGPAAGSEAVGSAGDA